MFFKKGRENSEMAGNEVERVWKVNVCNIITSCSFVDNSRANCF